MAKRGQGEGSIYQRASDGKWAAVISLGYENGKRKRKVIYGDTRGEVARKLTEELRRRDQNLPIITDHQTVEAFLNFWLENEIRPPAREPKTYEQYESICRIHLIPAIGKHKLNKLTPQHVQAMLRRKANEGSLSASSRKTIHSILRAALNRALAQDLVGRNVAAVVRAPTVEREEIRPWTKEDAERFLDQAKKDRLGALFTVAMALGLRKGEALGLRWEDVDFEEGILSVRMQLQRTKQSGLILKTPKTKRSRRRISLPAPTAAALKAHRTRQLEERLAKGPKWHDSGHVFVTTIGTMIEPTNVNKVFTRLVAAAKVPYQRFHDQRHWCASLLLAQGVPMRMVMEILGHSQISTTMDIYGHNFDEDKTAAADLMGKIFEGFASVQNASGETA